MPWYSMIVRLILAILVLIAPLNSLFAATPQRDRRPRSGLGDGVPVTAKGMTLPVGTVIVLRLETRLDSGRSRPSDRFTARVIEPVIDDRGKELVPQGTSVEGYVESVVPAQSRRRSGVIAVRFDMLRLPSGRALPLAGLLAAADPDDRRRIDEEGQVSGGSTKKRTVVFIGGGAGAGAAVGAIVGGAVLGAGVGAAAGVFSAWLAKGKEAIVEPGTRLGIELTEPLDLGLGAEGITRLEPRQPVRETKETRERREIPASRKPEGNPLTEGVLVKWNEVYAERSTDGEVRVLVTAETPSAGWRVYADQTVAGDTLEVWLRGNRPTGMSAQVISHPKVALTAPDAAGAIRRVKVHGVNGERVVAIPAGGRGSAEGAIGELGARIGDKIEVMVNDYATSIGAKRKSDGRYEFSPQRQPQDAQIELLFALSNLLDSAQLLRGVLGAEASAESRRRGTDRLATQAQEVDRRAAAARPSDNFTRKWQSLRDEIQQLVEMAARQ